MAKSSAQIGPREALYSLLQFGRRRGVGRNLGVHQRCQPYDIIDRRIDAKSLSCRPFMHDPINLGAGIEGATSPHGNR